MHIFNDPHVLIIFFLSPNIHTHKFIHLYVNSTEKLEYIYLEDGVVYIYCFLHNSSIASFALFNVMPMSSSTVHSLWHHTSISNIRFESILSSYFNFCIRFRGTLCDSIVQDFKQLNEVDANVYANPSA